MNERRRRNWPLYLLQIVLIYGGIAFFAIGYLFHINWLVFAVDHAWSWIKSLLSG